MSPHTTNAFNRLSSVDSLRGLLLVLMALDHARSFIHKSHPSEFWGVSLPNYDGDVIALMIRIVTHVCPSGFFLLMGISMALFSQRGELNGRELRRHFLIRGTLLVLLQITLVNIAWLIGGMSATVAKEKYGLTVLPGDTGNVWVYWGVLSSLGTSMIISSFVLSFKPSILLILALAILVAEWFLIEGQVVDGSVNGLLRIIGIPGQSDWLLVRYSISPWISLTFIGIALGPLIKNGFEIKHIMKLAGIFCLSFLVLRFLSLGDYHQIQTNSFIDWLNFTKYPASVVYLCFTLGLLALLYSMCSLFNLFRIFVTFGKATLFFYIVHLYLYGVIGYLFPKGGGWGWVLFMWIAGLLLLYPMCLSWHKFKKSSDYRWVQYF